MVLVLELDVYIDGFLTISIFGGEIMRFLIFSDSKGKEKGINEKVLSRLLKESKRLRPEPDFIMLGGDNVAGSNNMDIYMAQLQRLRALIDICYPGIALLPVIGNHEVNNEPVDDSYEKIFRSIYNDVLPHNCLQGYNNTVYYSDYGNTRFIALNSFHYGELNRIGERQLNWLQDTASKPVKNKIVFVHSPAFPTGAHMGHCLDLNQRDRDAFWNIVENCNVDIVFSGHEHNYSRRKCGSIYQIITGGAGEKLKDKYKDKKGVIAGPTARYHFIAVDFDDMGLKVSAIGLEGKLLDEFTIDKH